MQRDSLTLRRERAWLQICVPCEEALSALIQRDGVAKNMDSLDHLILNRCLT